MQRPAVRLRVSGLLIITISSFLVGCGSINVQQPEESTRVAEVQTPIPPSATPRPATPTLVPTPTLGPSTTPEPVPPTPTAEPPAPTATSAPIEPTPTQATATPTTPLPSALTDYRDPNGTWTLQYPADMLTPEELSPEITVFISADRGTVAAVDTYEAEGNAFGNTGEDLRNRARDALERIYGKPVNEVDILQDPEGDWATGITFTTDGGSKGEAVYMQPGFRQGDRRVYGFIYGYKAASEATTLPTLQAMRTSFQVKAQAGPPPVLFAQGTALMEQRGTEPAEQIADVPELGQVAAAGSFGDVVLILDERGLHRVLLSDGSSQILQQFSGPVRFGQILVSGELAIVAATVDDADAQFGFRTHIGIYDHIVDSFNVMPGTPELEQYTSLEPLGLTTNGNSIYAVPRGQDPSFTRVVLLSVETGEIEQDLPINGEGAIALSPDARTIVTIYPVGDDRASYAALFYDLETQPLEPRAAPLPPELGNASLAWAPDSQVLYILASEGAESLAAHDLVQMDVASGEITQIATLNRADQLVSISPNERWLLARSSSDDVGAIVDLQAGTIADIILPPEAFVAGWR